MSICFNCLTSPPSHPLAHTLCHCLTLYPLRFACLPCQPYTTVNACALTQTFIVYPLFILVVVSLLYIVYFLMFLFTKCATFRMVLTFVVFLLFVPYYMFILL